MNYHNAHVFFPLFVSLEGKSCVVVGGGKIAQRRIEVLLSFGCTLKVVSPELTPKLEKLAQEKAFVWIPREYEDGDLQDAFLVVAATDRRDINRLAASYCNREGILISTADCGEECTFHFPAIVRKGNLVAGLNSGGRDHTLVKEAAAFLRIQLEQWNKIEGELDEENKNRKP